jgi:hypothetical protein
MTEPTFQQELEALLNGHSQENASNTPDFILAEYLIWCLSAWNRGIAERERWYGRTPSGSATVGDAPEPPPEIA